MEVRKWKDRYWWSVVVALAWTTLHTPNVSHGGRIQEDWDNLPQIYSLVFSKSSLGMATLSGQFFVLNRTTDEFQEIDRTKFQQQFPKVPEPSAQEIKNIDGTVGISIFRTSNGKQFTARSAYCAEGNLQHHVLMVGENVVSDNVKLCSSISSVEIVENQLWLGTRLDGEYGEYPAEGLVIQTMETGDLVRRMSTTQGLTGNLIRLIRLDSFSSTVWVVTERGINQIDSNFRVIRSYFFVQELDSRTGRPKIGLELMSKASDPLIRLYSELAVSDGKRFSEAAGQIPPAIREDFADGLFRSERYSPDNANHHAVERAFAPIEANILVPFFIEAALSTNANVRHTAQFYLLYQCTFNDPRVIKFISDESKHSGRIDIGGASRCIAKYTRFGLLTPGSRIELLEMMYGQLRMALFRGQGTSDPVDFRLIVETARTMKQSGDLRGMHLINSYFSMFENGQFNSGLYDYVGQHLIYDSEIAPAMISGLKSDQNMFSYRGCSFFDMRWNFLPRRFDASYAEAILTSLDGRSSRSHSISGVNVCIEAFKSQLNDPETRVTFFRDVFPTLTDNKKMLANRYGGNK